MTKLLYLDDSYLKTCEAAVLSCEKAERGYWVTLDQTVLYPTGGGQPHDTGRIGGVPVLDVVEENETVLHLLASPLELGKRVSVEIDWNRRFDHMQQHCGEHLLSFAAKELFGTINIGFHMAEAYCTIDLDMPLESAQLSALEQRANALVWANLPVEIQYVTAEELEGLELRKKAKGLSGSIRIISMPGGDSCTCCGTHTAFTGEIGSIKITAAEHYKGGERITFACGARALTHAQEMQRIADTLARKYSCKPEDAPAAIEKQQQELGALKRENKAIYARLLAYLQEELLQGAVEAGSVKLCVRLVDLPPAQLRPLALALCAQEKLLALLLARQGDTLQYVLCCSEKIKLDMGDIAQAVNGALSAKGGGRGTLAQGSGSYSPGVREALEQLESYLKQVMRAG